MRKFHSDVFVFGIRALSSNRPGNSTQFPLAALFRLPQISAVRDGSKILEVRSHSRVENMSVLDPSDITTDSLVLMSFGESHEAHEISVDEEKHLEIDDALKVFGANWILSKEQRLCVDKPCVCQEGCHSPASYGFWQKYNLSNPATNS